MYIYIYIIYIILTYNIIYIYIICYTLSTCSKSISHHGRPCPSLNAFLAALVTLTAPMIAQTVWMKPKLVSRPYCTAISTPSFGLGITVKLGYNLYVFMVILVIYPVITCDNWKVGGGQCWDANGICIYIYVISLQSIPSQRVE